jgi:hypothetical protein
MAIWIFFSFLLTACQPVSAIRVAELSRLNTSQKPKATELLWSPVDQEKILVLSGKVNFRGGEIFLLDTKTGEKDIFVQVERGDIGIRHWLPDGSAFIMTASSSTDGFEQGGAWEVKIDNKSFSYLGQYCPFAENFSKS